MTFCHRSCGRCRQLLGERHRIVQRTALMGNTVEQEEEGTSKLGKCAVYQTHLGCFVAEFSVGPNVQSAAWHCRDQPTSKLVFPPCARDEPPNFTSGMKIALSPAIRRLPPIGQFESLGPHQVRRKVGCKGRMNPRQQATNGRLSRQAFPAVYGTERDSRTPRTLRGPPFSICFLSAPAAKNPG